MFQTFTFFANMLNMSSTGLESCFVIIHLMTRPINTRPLSKIMLGIHLNLKKIRCRDDNCEIVLMTTITSHYPLLSITSNLFDIQCKLKQKPGKRRYHITTTRQRGYIPSSRTTWQQMLLDLTSP